MNTTNTRIKKLRKALDLTQAEFANRIKIKRNTLANYEIGRNAPIDAVVSLICREFHVNEEWLRNGTGEMFQPAPHDALDDLIEQYGLPREVRSMLVKFLELKPDEQEAVISYVKKVAADINAMEIPTVWNQSAALADTTPQQPQSVADPWGDLPPWNVRAADDPPNQQAMWEAEARAEAEELYQQILEQKKAEAGYSASPPTDCGGSGGVA